MTRRLVRCVLLAAVLAYVGVLVLAPAAAIVATVVRAGFDAVKDTFTRSDVRHAFYLSGVITAVTVTVTTALGVISAYVIARQRFVGQRLLDALVDLPLAVSPVIVGLMAVLLFGRGGWLEPLFAARGIQVIFALPSMVLVTIFICVPFTIRAVVPVLEQTGLSEEEAARTLGASETRTFFHVTLPHIRWALAYGSALTSARALGEIGAVLIVSGALQGKTETATLYIFRALEERQDVSGYTVALILAGISILLLLAIEAARAHIQRRELDLGGAR